MAKLWYYINSFIVKIIVLFINIYKIIRSCFPASCRFYPSCSEYFKIALIKKGFIKGSYLGIRRILKCHPFHPGGYDPI